MKPIHDTLTRRAGSSFAVAAVALVALAATGSQAAGATSRSSALKRGGTITVLSAGDVDHIDPGQAYYSFTYEISYATQRPLLAFQPHSVNAIPDLASRMPTVSKDGRTVTVHIRSGVRFSPPVNRAVTSADVKYAIERGFASSVANGYAPAYFGDVVGAPAKPPRMVPNIRGIETPNRTTLVFELKHPSGVFESALGLPMTAPVPAGYARPFDAKTQSDYGMHQVATGPYMIKNNSSGSINGIGYQPGKLIELVRNPNWNPKTSWRPAYADRILFKEGFQDPTVTTRQILSGSADVNGDTPPPPAELRSILANPQEKGQLTFTPTGGSRYIALNTRKAPFDKLDVRKAVAFVLDKNAMRLTSGRFRRRAHRHALHRPELRQQGLHAGRRLRIRPVPEPRVQRQRRQGEGDDAGRGLPDRDVHGAAGDDGGGQHAARLEHRAGRRRRPGQDRHQRQDDLGHPLDDVHAVLQRAAQRAGHLPERRLAAGLPRAADHPRRDVQRQEHRRR